MTSPTTYDEHVERAARLLDRHHLGNASRGRLLHVLAEHGRRGGDVATAEMIIAAAVERAADPPVMRAQKKKGNGRK